MDGARIDNNTNNNHIRWDDDSVFNETDWNEVGISNYSDDSGKRGDLRYRNDFDFDSQFFNSNNWRNVNRNNIGDGNIRRRNDNNNNNNSNHSNMNENEIERDSSTMIVCGIMEK